MLNRPRSCCSLHLQLQPKRVLNKAAPASLSAGLHGWAEEAGSQCAVSVLPDSWCPSLLQKGWIREAHCSPEADHATFSSFAVFPTSTKDSSVIGLDLLSEICRAVSIPVVSIGGISSQNAGSTVQAGCAGVAVVSEIFGREDPSAAAQKLRQEVHLALQGRAGPDAAAGQ